MIGVGKQLKMSSTKQKEIGFFFKPCEKLQQQNDHRPIEETQRASSDCIPEIAMNCQPHQPPKTFKFPGTVYGKQQRSFQHHWFEKYPWLDYDVEEDSMTCAFCKRQN